MSLKVAVYGISYNEDHHVQAWAESALSETYPGDCVIVGDMGSQDKTVFLLENGWGVKVHSLTVRPFRFDVARNTILALIPPDVDVCISMDMDEVLSPGWRAEIERCFSQAGNNMIISLQHRPGWIFDTGNRVHSRGGWVWRFPAHEGLYEYGMAKITTPPSTIRPFIIHNQDTNRPRVKYLDLLLLGVRENPRNKRCIHYYGRELVYAGRYAEALPWLELYDNIKGPPHPVEEAENDKLLQQCRTYCNVTT